MVSMEIATAVPGTVKSWSTVSKHAENYPLPPGPWLSEPNKVQWVDAATQLPCLIVRGPFGALCGYAGVLPGHPFHGKSYDDVDVDVHGRLTFAAGCQHPEDESTGVCHIPEPGTPDEVWWFGFDCAHCFDLMPGIPDLGMGSYIERHISTGDVYRDADYVAREVTSLAAQLDVMGDMYEVASRLVGK